MDLAQLKATLEQAGVVFEKGLDDAEIQVVEDKYELRFPPDLRTFLQHALPISKGWMNWRSAKEAEIRARLVWPYEGICFDVEQNTFWPNEWGERPSRLEDAFEIVRQHVARAPKLIPILSHRFIPDRPREEGNPVLSVYQTDIIYYGADLQDYFQNEFPYYFGRKGYRIQEPVRRIEFWSRLVELNE